MQKSQILQNVTCTVCALSTRICGALQQNREQVTETYFEIWTIHVGIGVKNNSSVDFEIFVFVFFTYLNMFSVHLHVNSD